MTGEDRSRDGGNFWMVVLTALALVATVIMLFSDSSAWLQIALLASLWATIIGFLLVTRARKDRDQAEAVLAVREREHDAELEALRARNEADRAADGLAPTAEAEVLREIREELAALRAQLEELSGREFGYEPAALQAEARRIREIEARAQQSEPTPVAEPAQPAEPTQPAEPAQSAEPAPQKSESAEDTAPIAPVRDQDENEAINALSHPAQQATSHISGAPSFDAVVGRVGSHQGPEVRNPLTDLIRERQAEREREEQEAREREEREARQRAARERAERAARERAAREARERAQQEARERAEREARERAEREARERAEREARERAEREARERAEREQPAQAVQAEPAEQAAAEEAHHGRRRADAHREGALTVAEILARGQKN
ncbi:DUF6779 domain-containing protein [Corynebacterium tuscaniense]|uniref:DUF6779 domain-containing protein n=1 Tax=Corynebacterium tuscaniense TaxID=302449 RepID=UPI000690D603|nr:DUF6779 domain-containing protein [Corynebacterium tuscaniense]